LLQPAAGRTPSHQHPGRQAAWPKCTCLHSIAQHTSRREQCETQQYVCVLVRCAALVTDIWEPPSHCRPQHRSLATTATIQGPPPSSGTVRSAHAYMLWAPATSSQTAAAQARALLRAAATQPHTPAPAAAAAAGRRCLLAGCPGTD
jgi:hypothetical protein